MGVTIWEDRGAWWIFVHHKGRRTKKRIGPAKEGQKAAKAVAENFQARLALGDTGFLEPAPLTFSDYAESWLSGYVATNLKLGSQEKYAAVLRKHWCPVIGHLPLADISRNHIRSVITSKLRQGMKLNTAKLVLDVLKACLNASEGGTGTQTHPIRTLGI